MHWVRRLSICAAVLFAVPAFAGSVKMLDLTPKPKPKPKPPKETGPHLFEVQLVMGDSETAKKLGDPTVEQLKSLGYDVNPAVVYGYFKDKKVAKLALNFDIMKRGDTCFVTGRAAELPADTNKVWGWSTKTDTTPCADQVKEAVADFSGKHPAAKKPAQ